MPVEEDEPRVGISITHSGHRADLQGAAAPEHDELALVVDRIGGGADRSCEVEHGIRPHDAGHRVSLGRTEEHVEVAEVAGTERLDDACLAKHAGGSHGAHGLADAVDRHAEDRDAAHHEYTLLSLGRSDHHIHAACMYIANWRCRSRVADRAIRAGARHGGRRRTRFAPLPTRPRHGSPRPSRRRRARRGSRRALPTRRASARCLHS